MYEKHIKRWLGVIFSGILLVLVSPIMLIIAILVRVKLGKPIFFVQERVGYEEKIFKLIKFRSMSNKKDENGNLLPDNLRLTRFGKILRKSSLDELPELINILKGDMAFVGPRPLLVSYLDLYNEDQHKRHNVRPGFTCIDIVKGRNTLPWIEKFKLDTYYAENVSLGLDFRIVIQTIFVVLLGKGEPDASQSNRGSIEIALKKEQVSNENK